MLWGKGRRGLGWGEREVLRTGPWDPEPLVGMGRGEGVFCLLGGQRRPVEGVVCQLRGSTLD